MLDGSPRSASCTASTPVLCGLLTRDGFSRLLHEHPDICARFMVMLAMRIGDRLRDNTLKALRRDDARHERRDQALGLRRLSGGGGLPAAPRHPLALPVHVVATVHGGLSTRASTNSRSLRRFRYWRGVSLQCLGHAQRHHGTLGAARHGLAHMGLRRRRGCRPAI